MSHRIEVRDVIIIIYYIGIGGNTGNIFRLCHESLTYYGFTGAWLFFNKPPAIFENTPKDITLNVASITVSQPIFTGFRTKNSVKIAEENHKIQVLQKEITRNTLFLEIGNLFYQIQTSLLQEAVLNESLLRLATQLTIVRNFLVAEQATPLDTLEVANRKLQIATQLFGILGQKKILVSHLEYMLNESDLPEITLLDLESVDLGLKPLDSYQQIALQKRPELANINAQILGQTYSTDIARAAYYPVVSASGAYNNARLDGFIFDGSWIDFYSVILNFQWELWGWHRDKRKVQQATLESQRLDLMHQQLLSDIKQQVKTAYQNLLINKEQIMLNQQLVQQEKERYRQTQERYQQGIINLLDMTTAEVDLTTAQLELHKTKIDWFKNKLRLNHAIGMIGYE